jgi:hypothetical protein
MRTDFVFERRNNLQQRPIVLLWLNNGGAKLRRRICAMGLRYLLRPNFSARFSFPLAWRFSRPSATFQPHSFPSPGPASKIRVRKGTLFSVLLRALKSEQLSSTRICRFISVSPSLSFFFLSDKSCEPCPQG